MITRNLLQAVERRTGFYTKRGCVETATLIGKELAEVQKAKGVLTKQDVLFAIKNNAPHIKMPNIATTKDEFISLMQEHGLNEIGQRYSVKTVVENERLGGIFKPDINGIYVKLEYPEELAEIFAHEVEHFIEYYNNPQTVIKRLLNSISNIKRKLANIREIENLKKVENKEKYIEERLSGKKKVPPTHEITLNLVDLFAARKSLNPLLSEGVAEGYEPTVEGLKQFFESPVYNGLTSDKRIDAYIRCILRHTAHPLQTHPSRLKFIRDSLEKEITAYEVSDNMIRYVAGKDGITAGTIRVEIFKRLVKILDNEIRTAKIARLKHKRPRRWIRTGLPTSAVNKNPILA